MEEKRLDTKTMIAFGIMFILMMFMFFNNEPPTPSTNNQNTEQTSANSQTIAQNTQSPVLNLTDSVQRANYKASLGAFGYSVELNTASENAFTEIENEVIKLKISNKGGQISELLVKGQKTYDGQPLYLIKDKNSDFGIEFTTQDNRTLHTKDLFFEPSVSGNVVSMKLKASDNQYLEFLYSLRPNEYLVDFDIRSVGLHSVINPQKSAHINWELVAQRMEKSVTYENRYVQLVSQYEGDRIEKLSESGDDDGQEKQVNWVAFKQHLFSSFLISEQSFASAQFKSKNLVKDEDVEQHQTKAFHFSAPLAFSGGELAQSMHWYFGPTDYYTLKKYDNYDLVKAIPLGWGIFGWINKWFVIPVFDFLSGFMPVGIAIIVLTIVVRILLSPIQYKSYLSQAKMKVLRPEIEEINKLYKEPMKRQQETMALYSKAGVNPMSGCVPALLQMPVFFALFAFFPTAYVLRQESFFWAKDLASYDAIAHLPFSIPFYGDHVSLLPILASIAIFIYMLMTTGQMQQPQQEGVPNMKFMIYLSPILMLFFFNNYASGLSLYYFISNLITIFIMLAIKYWIIDENKIHAKIQENKQKPRKESKFQRKMREMMEQAQEQQRQQQNRKK